MLHNKVPPFFFRKKNTTEGRGEDSKGEKLCFGLFSFNPKGGREVPSPKSQISPAVFRGVPLVLFFLSLRLHFFFPKRNLTWNMSFTIPIPPQKNDGHLVFFRKRLRAPSWWHPFL